MSYVQHLLPRLRFQLPVLSLTEATCNKIMSPTLKAALPRMHINRNTSRSIVHGPVLLGGMAIPHLFTVQGIDKLHLFLGHLRLGDDTGKLIRIDLSYVQLLTGTATFFLNKPYSNYTWLEWGWLTSLWSFVSNTQLSFDMPSHWVPMLPRRHDLYLMDYFIALRLPDAVLLTLNACRVYLQAITLSDITSADGTYILPEAKQGGHIPYRTSRLDWPLQGRPLPADWRLWRNSLAYLENKGKLAQPLGDWISSSHQHWTLTYDLRQAKLYRRDLSTGRWYIIPQAVRPARRLTRSSMRLIYDMSQPIEQEPLEASVLVPATPQYADSQLRVLIDFSSNAIPVLTPPAPLASPTFHRHIRALVKNGPHLQAIREAAASNSLIITADGSYHPISKRASYSWVFSGLNQRELLRGSSQTTADHRTPYRAELLGLYAALLIVQWVEELHPLGEGSALLISDCDKALKRVFRVGPIGIKDATQDEYDLILAIRRLHPTLSTKITPQWTPGHPTASDPRGEQVRNATAHFLAVQRLQEPLHSGFADSYIEAPTISVLHKGVPITRGLPQQIAADLHFSNLQRKLQKDNHWTESQFLQVDWESYHKAIISLPRPRRLTITKLSHSLWNTNSQNQKYYGQDPNCPCCPAHETQGHVFLCPSPAMAEARQGAIKALRTTLDSAGTPPPLLDALLHALHPSHITLPKDAPILAVLSTQSSLGFCSIHRGHLCQSWRDKYLHTLPSQTKQPEQKASLWCRRVIRAIWDYSLSLWAARNEVVHGHTLLQSESKAIRVLRQQVKTFYLRVENDPHLLPANRLHLFDKSLLATQQLPRPQLQCWIRSIEEAIQTQSFRNDIAGKSQRVIMERFFQPKGKLRAPSPFPPRRVSLPQKKPPWRNGRPRLLKCQPFRFPFKPRCVRGHDPLSPASPTKSILKQPVFTQLSSVRPHLASPSLPRPPLQDQSASCGLHLAHHGDRPAIPSRNRPDRPPNLGHVGGGSNSPSRRQLQCSHRFLPLASSLNPSGHAPTGMT
jgi:hypothetical protein